VQHKGVYFWDLDEALSGFQLDDHVSTSVTGMTGDQSHAEQVAELPYAAPGMTTKARAWRAKW
jgi:hypothetical protein